VNLKFKTIVDSRSSEKFEWCFLWMVFMAKIEFFMGFLSFPDWRQQKVIGDMEKRQKRFPECVSFCVCDGFLCYF
jgi:hypothetical protein